MKLLFFLLTLLSAFNVAYCQKYCTQSLSPEIKTVLAYKNGDELTDPVINIGTDEYVNISFDLMSHQARQYSYRIKQCNADWSLNQRLSVMDYMQGFEDNPIENYEPSLNTTADYTNYRLEIPNENAKPLLSGNYAVEIFETEHPEKTVATACFSINENKTSLESNISPNTNFGVKTKFQQLNFSININEVGAGTPQSEFYVTVTQNGRADNIKQNIAPRYTTPEKLIFEDVKSLIFEGGKEFSMIDFSHIRNFSGEIERISFHRPYYHVEVMAETEQTDKGYEYYEDVDGRFKIHGQSIWTDREIDYSIVHFTFKREEPWLDGSMYISGRFNGGRLDNNNKMTYNFERQQYELDIMLKNGGYNYQFLFLPAGLTAATMQRTSGSFWETKNEYAVSVYHRPNGSRHDKLVGYHIIKQE